MSDGRSGHMHLRSWTDSPRAEAFIRQEVRGYRTAGLTVWLKRIRHGPEVRGHYRRVENRIIVAVGPTAAFPFELRLPARTAVLSTGRLPWEYDRELARDPDELLVWLFFHEVPHYLCFTNQRVLDWHTRANAFGFEFLRRFRVTRDSAFDSSGFPPGDPAPASLAGPERR